MQEKNILYTKSYAFSIPIVKLSQYLSKEKKEYVLNKQIIRSGTDYISKPMHDSLLKDCKELVGLLVSITKTLKDKGIIK
jgi:hypothetical protein